MSKTSLVFMLAIVATMSVVSSVSMTPDAEAFKRIPIKSIDATNGIVCGDRLCSQSASDETTNSSALEPIIIEDYSIKTDNSESKATHETKKYHVFAHTQQSIILSFDSQIDGSISVELPEELGNVSMVIIDGEEWDDILIDENELSIDYFAGTETIEIIVE